MTHVDFTEEWTGWRLRGRHLVSEDGQRMTVERLRGLLWRDTMELRLAGYASRRDAENAKRAASCGPRIKVVIVELSEYRIQGRAAG